MRFFLSLILAVLILIPSAFAAKHPSSQLLYTGGAAVSNYLITNGSTLTSDGVQQIGNIGFASMILNVSGNVSVSCEVSKDGSTWYTPYTTDGSSLTSTASIATSVTSNSWIILIAKLAPYIRYKFTANGDSTITATMVWQEEN